MPMYEFMNFETGQKINKFFSINGRPEEVIIEDTVYKYIISAPAIVSGVNGIKGVPSNLKDRLSQIKKYNPEMQSSVV